MSVDNLDFLARMSRHLTRRGPMPTIGVVPVLASMAIVALSFNALTPTAAIVSCALGWTMLAVATIDAQRMVIPDILSLPAIPCGLLASGYLLDPTVSEVVRLDNLIGACLGGASFWLVRETYWRLRTQEGLGLGDVKLAAAAGAWAGWANLPNVVLLAACVALVFAGARAMVRRNGLSRTERVAFGAFLAPSIWIVWVLTASVEGL